MTTKMDDKGAARTTAQDHLRSMLDLMRQGARINLSGIPDDPTFLSSNIPGEIAKEIAALIQPPTPASGDQMEVVEQIKGELLWAFKKWQHSHTAEELVQTILESPALSKALSSPSPQPTKEQSGQRKQRTRQRIASGPSTRIGAK